MKFDSDDEIDLRWFFVEARGRCGVRSSLGPQLDALASGTVSSGGCRRSTPDMADHMLESAARANAIGERLRALPDRFQDVLRLQYERDEAAPGCEVGMSRQVDGVTIALLIAGPTARRLLNRTARVAKHATPVLWIAWLLRKSKQRDGANEKEILATIVREAKAKLTEAHHAFSLTRNRSAGGVRRSRGAVDRPHVSDAGPGDR